MTEHASREYRLAAAHDLGKTREQNREYVSYMQHAEKPGGFSSRSRNELLAQPLGDEAPQSLASSNVWPLLVYTRFLARDDLVTVAAPAAD